MGIIIWLIVGGICGWLASIIMKRDAQQGIFMNIIVGIVGAVLAGWLISPLVGVGTINDGITVGRWRNYEPWLAPLLSAAGDQVDDEQQDDRADQ